MTRQIARIDRLRNVGIFRDHVPKRCQPFLALNLILGPNASGKSTLSRIFEALEAKAPLPSARFPNAEFQVTGSDGTTVTQATVATSSFNVRTFNQSFVRNNIDWDDAVKGILLVSEERIAEKKKIEELLADREKLIAARDAHTNSRAAIASQVATFLTESARTIKQSLQVIDVKDSRFLNYNKTKLEEFVEHNRDALSHPDAILSATMLAQTTAAAKPEHKPAIQPIATVPGSDVFDRTLVSLRETLTTSAVSQAIERLNQHPDIYRWVRDGVDLHQRHQSQTCEFCGNAISEARQRALNGHFNDQFKELGNRIARGKEYVEKQLLGELKLPAASELFEEFRSDFVDAADDVRAAAKSIDDELREWLGLLDVKLANPLDTNFKPAPISPSALNALEASHAKLVAAVASHNAKVDDFESDTKRAKRRLELHYAASVTKNFGLDEKIKAQRDLSSLAATTTQEIAKIDGLLRELEGVVSSPGVGATQFNKALHTFLGRGDLILRFEKSKGGYSICRDGATRHETSLSEGERTAIAFIYFITKLKENGNPVENTVVVIDDPVSSFDSSNLFHAFAFLKTHCKKALQLFVLTHNFSFFKLVRDWFLVENSRHERKHPVARIFCLEPTASTPRSTDLVDAHKTLTDYQSEYHYVYRRLSQLSKRGATLNIDECYLAANMARKVLESFFSFKHPKARPALSSLLHDGLAGCTKTTVADKERIYAFVNKYSHSSGFSESDESAENVIGESPEVLKRILDWIEEVDPSHHKEMERLSAD
jgi:wobble nucleotide-excising tRNase